MSARRNRPAQDDAAKDLVLSVDMIRCDGHGICAWLFPERIWLDRWGYPVVDPTVIEGNEAHKARRAIRACPRGALTVNAVARSNTSANVQP